MRDAVWSSTVSDTLERHFGLMVRARGPSGTGWSAGHAFAKVTWLNGDRFEYRVFRWAGTPAQTSAVGTPQVACGGNAAQHTRTDLTGASPQRAQGKRSELAEGTSANGACSRRHRHNGTGVKRVPRGPHLDVSQPNKAACGGRRRATMARRSLPALTNGPPARQAAKQSTPREDKDLVARQQGPHAQIARQRVGVDCGL